MFGSSIKNLTRSVDALLELNEERQRTIDAHQQSIDALLETNDLMRRSIERLRQRIELLEARPARLPESDQ